MKIAVFGNFGVENLGDDLILQGLMKKYPDDELTVFCGRPEVIARDFGLQATKFFPGGLKSMLRSWTKDGSDEFLKSRQVLSSVDEVVIGGGGILVDRHLKAILLWWMQLQKIRKSGKPYSFVANSFELQRSWTRKLFWPFFRDAKSISVRDSASQEFIRSLGLEAELVKDLAWEVELEGGERRNGMDGRDGRDGRREKVIALALCQWGVGEVQLRALRSFVQQRRAEGYDVIGLAFQTYGDDDREIFAKLDPTLPVITGLQQVLNSLRSAHLLIGMRYHAVLMGQRCDIPTIALSYQEKISNLMRDAGQSAWLLPIQNVDEQKLQELFGKAVEGMRK